MIVISCSPIRGNENTISNVINKLYERGANVIYNALVDVHVSGHACQEELKLMHTLVQPRFFIPVHGEYRHLKQHALVAESLGMDRQNIIIPNLGGVIELTRNKCVETGKVPAGRVFIDGLGVGDVGNIVLRDRRRLSQDGLMIVIVTVSKENNAIVGEPDIVSRGFVYVKESGDLIDEARRVVVVALHDCVLKEKMEWSDLKGKVREALSKYLYSQTGRRPMILPVIVEA
jgi:ribonuclease J